MKIITCHFYTFIGKCKWMRPKEIWWGNKNDIPGGVFGQSLSAFTPISSPHQQHIWLPSNCWTKLWAIRHKNKSQSKFGLSRYIPYINQSVIDCERKRTGRRCRSHSLWESCRVWRSPKTRNVLASAYTAGISVPTYLQWFTNALAGYWQHGYSYKKVSKKYRIWRPPVHRGGGKEMYLSAWVTTGDRCGSRRRTHNSLQTCWIGTTIIVPKLLKQPTQYQPLSPMIIILSIWPTPCATSHCTKT